jgi:hypothetical protein
MAHGIQRPQSQGGRTADWTARLYARMPVQAEGVYLLTTN